MKIRSTHMLLGVLIVLSAVLAHDAFTSYVDPYLTVSQVVENNAAYINKEIRVIGVVVNGSIGWTTNSTMSFDLADDKSRINVVYQGSSLQNFNEGQQVVVIGELVSPHSIGSSQILVKCPSKYEGEQRSLLTDPIFLAAMALGGIALVYYVATVVPRKG